MAAGPIGKLRYAQRPSRGGTAAADLDPAGLGFVTFDERLAVAAEKEGFSVLGA